MGSLKDGLDTAPKSFTLTPEEVEYMKNIHSFAQAEVDAMQQRLAATFLHFVATSRFGYGENTDLRFNFDPTKSDGNLEIVELPG